MRTGARFVAFGMHMNRCARDPERGPWAAHLELARRAWAWAGQGSVVDERTQVVLGDHLKDESGERYDHPVEIDVPHERGEHVGEGRAAQTIAGVAGLIVLGRPWRRVQHRVVIHEDECSRWARATAG